MRVPSNDAARWRGHVEASVCAQIGPSGCFPQLCLLWRRQQERRRRRRRLLRALLAASHPPANDICIRVESDREVDIAKLDGPVVHFTLVVLALGGHARRQDRCRGQSPAFVGGDRRRPVPGLCERAVSNASRHSGKYTLKLALRGHFPSDAKGLVGRSSWAIEKCSARERWGAPRAVG